MESDQKQPPSVTGLVRLYGATFAVTREGQALGFRVLPVTSSKPAPEGAQLLLFPRKDP